MNHKIIPRLIFLVAISFLVVVLFVGQTKTKLEKVNIGVILPLTGSLAKTGFDAKVGLEMAETDLPNAKINLIFEDDSFTPKESVTVFSKLVNMTDVVAVIGPLNGSSIESVRTLAIQNKLPIFTPYGAGNSIGDFVYKNSVEGSDEAKIMADRANNLGYKRLAIMYLQNDFGMKYLNSFKKAIIENGGELVIEEATPLSVKDFRTSLVKIKATKPDAIYLVNNSVIIAEIIKQSADLGLNIPFLSQYAVESPDLLRIAGKPAEGMLYTFPINDKALSERQKIFISEFEKKVGERPQIIAYNAYDIYTVLSEAIDKCGSDRVCVNDYLANIRAFDGVGGIFSIQDGKLVRDFYFKTIKNGQFVSAE